MILTKPTESIKNISLSDILMGIFKDMLKSSETIFKNPVALDFDFMPKLVPYREKEQFKIAGCIKPLMHGRNGRNLMITGSPGIGKTVACKHVLRELGEETEIIPIYVNCWHRNTSYKAAMEICEILGYRFVHNKRTEELFSEIKKIVNKKSAVFVFDEADKLEDSDILYWVLEDIYRKSVILIANNKSLINDIDSRIKSRMTPELLEFHPYNLDETKGILKQRIKYAFFPDVVDEHAFNMICSKAYNLRDVRTGLYLLKESGNIAEENASKKINAEHAKKAIEKILDFSSKELDDDTKTILELIKEKQEAKIGDIFNMYQNQGGESTYRTFQRKIKKLEETHLVSVKKQVGGASGTTSIISYGQEKKLTEF